MKSAKQRELEEALAPIIALLTIGGCIVTVCLLHRTSNENTLPMLALIVAVVALLRTFRR